MLLMFSIERSGVKEEPSYRRVCILLSMAGGQRTLPAQQQCDTPHYSGCGCGMVSRFGLLVG